MSASNDEAAKAWSYVQSMGEDVEQAFLTYMKGEPADVTALRAKEQPEFPWPSVDNPMFQYLLKRAYTEVQAVSESAQEEQALHELITWLTVHAWYEGALAGLSTASNEAPMSDQESDREAVVRIMQRIGVSERTARGHVAADRERVAKERRRMIQGEQP